MNGGTVLSLESDKKNIVNYRYTKSSQLPMRAGIMKSSKKHSNDHRASERPLSVLLPEDRKDNEDFDFNIHDVKELENLKIKIGDVKRLTSGNKDSHYCYCSVQLDCEEVYKTRLVEKTLSPFFQEECIFDIPQSFNFLSFHLHEQDDVLSKRDAVIAKVVLKKADLFSCNGVESWYPLVPVSNRDEVQGQLFVEIKFEHHLNLNHSGSHDPHKLSVRIPKCNGLIGGLNCAPYLSVTLQGVHHNETKKSRVKRGSTNPTFDEEFIFELNKTNSLRRSWFDLSLGSSEGRSFEERWDLQTVRISVYHNGTLGDTFLGEVKIPLSKVTHKYSGWHMLNSRSDKNSSSTSKEDLGSLRIKITYTKDLVFPSNIYQILLNNLIHSSLNADLSASWPALIGAICGSKKQSAVAQHLVHIFLHESKLLNLIRPLADFEISSSKNIQTIFRNSSFASFIIEETLRVVGKNYLHKVLASDVERIAEEGKSCEIDPARVMLGNGVSTSRAAIDATPTTAGEMVHHNKEHLWKYVQSILNSIIESASDCPDILCGLFNDLRSSAAKHFPDDVNMRYRVVSNFLFLRFFSLALLCPRKYKLVSIELSTSAKRTFSLVSRSIQLLCNLALPRPSSRTHVDCTLRNFIDEFVAQRDLEKVKNFIDIVSSSSGSTRDPRKEYLEKVTLKEGEMVKRAQGRAFLLGKKNFKTRYFLLTNYELTYFKHKKGKPLCVIPVQQIIGVEKLQEESFRMSNMFQVIQPNRILYCKAGNSVEQKEWMDLLTKVCNCNSNRAQQYHPGAYVQGKYSWLPTSVRINIDQDRDLERLYVALTTSQEHIRSLQEECGARSVYVGPDPKSDDVESEAENTDDGETLHENNSNLKPLPLPLDSLDPQQTYRTLCSILECIQTLDRFHARYKEGTKPEVTEQPNEEA